MKFTKEEIRKSLLLYAVTDRMWLNEGETLISVAEEVLKNGATFLQIREKALNEDDFEAEAEALHALCAKYRVPFVVNDSVEIALRCNADGVHVGQEDMAAAKARQLLGPDKIIGVSCKTPEQAKKAQADGADYIGTGAAFATTTKKDTRALSREELQAVAEAVDIPVVAIGGINAGNLLELSGCGVDGVAVVSAIFAQDDPRAAAEELRALSDQMVAR